MSSLSLVASERGFETLDTPCGCCEHNRDSSDLVALKISLLGDSQIGKTSFLANEVCWGREMDKTLCVRGARTAYRIWEVAGDETSQNHIPSACKDSVVIIVRRYQESRKWNQTAIPVLIGTKFDDFVQLPIDVQWTIASQARAYARALNATLFFFKCNLQHKCEQELQVHHGKLHNFGEGTMAKILMDLKKSKEEDGFLEREALDLDISEF
ncbi:hypothetical protein HYC85_011992 [Camellia sinensis]|uniref:Uncharacterized protein n=1 Tax=Camellia sinensis TaxID=4442 RepID=A0A7J7HB74_CAMSI|nr:hypothetical protein HYC85_011992 [Camellia sinensis]